MLPPPPPPRACITHVAVPRTVLTRCGTGSLIARGSGVRLTKLLKLFGFEVECVLQFARAADFGEGGRRNTDTGPGRRTRGRKREKGRGHDVPVRNGSRPSRCDIHWVWRRIHAPGAIVMCPCCCCCCKRCVRRSQLGPLPGLLLRRRWCVGAREGGRVWGIALRVAHGVVRGRWRLARRLCCWRAGGCCVWGRHEGPRVLVGSSASAARSFACGGLLCSSHGTARLHELVVSMCVSVCVCIIHTCTNWW